MCGLCIAPSPITSAAAAFVYTTVFVIDGNQSNVLLLPLPVLGNQSACTNVVAQANISSACVSRAS